MVNFYLGAKSETELAFMANDLLPAVIRMQNAEAAFNHQKKACESTFFYGDANYLYIARLWEDEVRDILGNIVNNTNIDPIQKEEIRDFLTLHQQWSEKAYATYTLSLDDLDEDVEKSLAELARIRDKLTENLRQLSDSLTQALVSGNSLIIEQTRLNRFGSLALFLIIASFSSLAVFIVLKRIVTPIQELAEVSREITAGNLDKQVEVVSQDETGDLGRAFNAMTQQLKETLEKVRAEVTEKEKAELEVLKINAELEGRVQQRTEELQEIQQELLENAHKAGMADIATGTLHNIGNILNSVQVSSEIIKATLAESPLSDMTRAGGMVREHQEGLDEFIAGNPKAPKLFLYYQKIEERFVKEHEALAKSANRLEDKIAAIGDVIAAQQNYAVSAAFQEKIDVGVILDDALTMRSSSLEKSGVKIIKEYQSVPETFVQKTKFLHVLVNLIKNAEEAMLNQESQPQLAITTTAEADNIYIKISDTGEGIVKEQLDKIFVHGFTTKASGHGFGLHSCANYMTEIKGSIEAASPGRGLGTTFTLILPIVDDNPFEGAH